MRLIKRINTRKVYFYLLVLIVFSCQPSTKKENIENQTEASQSTIQQTIIDTTITLLLENDTVYYKKGKILVCKKFIQSKIVIGGDSLNPKELKDEAFLIANCLVILKDIKTAGYFCHIPEVGSVEIYTPDGKSRKIKRGEKNSNSLLGSDFTSNFLGNKFSSPDNLWGLIMITAEGDMYGFLIIKSDGSVKEVNFEENSLLSGEMISAIFNANNELVWKELYMNNESVELLIKSDGNFKRIKK